MSSARRREVDVWRPTVPCDRGVFNGRPRWYAIWKTPVGFEQIIGVWKCPWSYVLQFFPNQSLFGSGVDCKGFDTYEEALYLYRFKRHGHLPITRIYVTGN